MSSSFFIASINACLILSSGICVGLGWYFILHKQVEAHKKAMLTGAILAVLFLVLYACKVTFIGGNTFGGPSALAPYYRLFLFFHMILAVIGAVFGVITIRSGLKMKIEKHRKLGPITATIWLITVFTGLLVYLLLYILFPHGDTASLLKAILG